MSKVVPGEVVQGEVVPGEVIQGEVVPGEVVDVESPPAAVVDAQFESDDGREEEEAIAPVKPSNWTCPVCKRPNGAQTQKCGVCGTRKDYNPDPERRQHEYAAEAERRRRAAEAKAEAERQRRARAKAAKDEEEKRQRCAKKIDLSKLALVRTLKGHSESVRCAASTYCAGVMRLRCRSIALQCFRTGGASCLVVLIGRGREEC